MNIQQYIPEHTTLEELRAALQLARDTAETSKEEQILDALYLAALRARTLDEFRRAAELAGKLRRLG